MTAISPSDLRAAPYETGIGTRDKRQPIWQRLASHFLADPTHASLYAGQDAVTRLETRQLGRWT